MSNRFNRSGYAGRFIFLCLCVCFMTMKATSQAAQEWKLQPVSGDNGKGWIEEPNWTWSDGNPMTTDDGARWQLTAQLEMGPSLTSTYTNLVKGYYAKYYRVWRGPGQSDTDAINQYRNYLLCSRGFSDNVGAGYATAIFFTPPEAGTYKFEIAGTIDMQNPTAGWGRVTLYTLSADGTSATELAVFNLNEEGGYRSSIYPASFSFNKNVELVEGERFALRLQSVNPGKASSGTVRVDFDPVKRGKFVVTKVLQDDSNDSLSSQKESKAAPTLKNSKNKTSLNTENESIVDDVLGIPAVPLDGTGNLNYFAGKVQRGESVSIGYIGGSITHGAGASSFGKNYYWKSSRKLLSEAKKFGNTNVKVKQAAVGGTGSEYGACRVGIQLLNAGLDLLIIEFAVNDGGNDAAIRGMEGIVRHALRVNPNMAVVFLYTTTASAVNEFYMKGEVMPSVLRHHKVAKHYGIAEVHCGPVVAAGIKQGLYTSKDFFKDGVHPSDMGHEVYADLLVNALIPTFGWKASDGRSKPLPEPLMNDDLAYAEWTKIEPSEKSGNWEETKPGFYTYSGGWKTTSAATMKFPVKGKKITLVFGNSNAKIKISGLGYEKTFTKIRQNPPWVPKRICIYAGSVQKEGIVTITVEPAASGETMFDIEGVISECKE